MSRMTELGAAAAAALDDGQDPLQPSFLAEHDVTADECFGLAARMALGLRLVQLLQATDPLFLAGAATGARLAAAARALEGR